MLKIRYVERLDHMSVEDPDGLTDQQDADDCPSTTPFEGQPSAGFDFATPNQPEPLIQNSITRRIWEIN